MRSCANSECQTFKLPNVLMKHLLTIWMLENNLLKICIKFHIVLISSNLKYVWFNQCSSTFKFKVKCFLLLDLSTKRTGKRIFLYSKCCSTFLSPWTRPRLILFRGPLEEDTLSVYILDCFDLIMLIYFVLSYISFCLL